MTSIPIQVAFHGLDPSDALDAYIRERAAWLDQFHSGITRCRVVVEVPHRHRHDGRHFRIRVELSVRGTGPIVISRAPSLHGPLKDIEEPAHRKETGIDGEHRSAYAAVHEAFDDARRRLQDAGRELRGAVKTHEVPAHGEVAEISVAEGCGFIDTPDHRVYFRRASVLDGAFEERVPGTPVVFVEEQGEKGPRASTVRVLGEHQHLAP